MTYDDQASPNPVPGESEHLFQPIGLPEIPGKSIGIEENRNAIPKKHHFYILKKFKTPPKNIYFFVVNNFSFIENRAPTIWCWAPTVHLWEPGRLPPQSEIS